MSTATVDKRIPATPPAGMREERGASSSPFLTSKEVCNILKISKWELQKMVQTKRIPFYRFGHRTVRFEKRQIEAWIQSKKVSALAVRGSRG